MNYSEKLKDPRWQKKRLEILERDEWACKRCGNNKKTLHVHHKKYHKEPWDAKNNDLETLCEDCHAEEKSNNDTKKEIIGFLDTYTYDELSAVHSFLIDLSFMRSEGHDIEGMAYALCNLVLSPMALEFGDFIANTYRNVGALQRRTATLEKKLEGGPT